MTIRTSTIGGSGALVKLAPDLTHLSNQLSANQPQTSITGINAVGSLTTALSLTGRFIFSWAEFRDLTNENMTFKMTIDGVVIFDDTFVTGATSYQLIGSTSTSDNMSSDGPFLVGSSLLIEVQTDTDNNITLDYLARPIV